MARLSEHVKTFIVQQLACYETPSDVVTSVKQAFPDLTVTKQQVEYYDPTKRASSNGLPQKWKHLFWQTREDYNLEAREKGAGNLNYRIAHLQQWAEKAAAVKNFEQARKLLKQVAEDAGGLYTNKREMKLDARESLALLLGVPVENLPADTTPKSNAKP